MCRANLARLDRGQGVPMRVQKTAIENHAPHQPWMAEQGARERNAQPDRKRGGKRGAAAEAQTQPLAINLSRLSAKPSFRC